MENTRDLDWNIPNLKRNNSTKPIQDYITKHIVSGDLPPNSFLPSIRTLSEKIKVSRNTVNMAYRLLKLANWLSQADDTRYKVAQCRPGSIAPPLLIKNNFRGSILKSNLSSAATDTSFIGIAKNFIKSGNSPFVHYMKDLRKHLKENGYHTQLNNLEAYKGFRLNASICKYINSKNKFKVELNQLSVVHGRLTCLNCIFKVILKPGDTVINTSCNDHVLASAFQLAGVKVINLDSSSADFLGQLEKALQRKKIRALHIRTQCNFLNSHTLAEADAAAVMALSVKNDFTIIEEEDNHEFWYGEKPYLPLVGHPEQDRVIYIAALSKASLYLQSIRVVIAAENFINMLNAIPCHSIEARNIAAEETVIDMMDSGKLLSMIKHHNSTAADNGRLLTYLVENYLKKYSSCVMPKAGLSLWIMFRVDIDVLKALRLMETKGLEIPFHPVQTYLGPSRYLRYGFGDFEAREAETFIKGLQEALVELYG
ncbi:GntR family transcriptional regulator [Pedobacter sp. MC2016-14]|uniref:GntR family transcriptional regulator n=1 Tax=Pedobacter sp. MC2016-14 TaxID=2897327 RepID=UPI001E48841E|nr:GntR family transcriptional regulator [Pedobacter sp. MC2016-14]MCD0487926.1 GntR family transcriptional regulator [Pedobacter sp. MC2016-14]